MCAKMRLGMPNWSEVLEELRGTTPSDKEHPLDTVRRKYLKNFQKLLVAM